ncbi:MAG: hypothetical protein K8T90_03155 [Planctomycetes bacterium]|nr:hypothetical protein [Planctomycetota bacterium]
MKSWKIALCLVPVAAAALLVPTGDAAAKGPKPGTWTAVKLAGSGFGQQVLLDSTSGAMQVEYLDMGNPKTFAVSAPAGAPRGVPGTYAIAPDTILVNFGMGDSPTIHLFNSATGASWFYNGTAWQTVTRVVQ